MESMTTWDPSLVSPALTPQYLTPIADRIWAVQAKVAKHVRPDEGDDDWVAGCTGYRRRCVALERMQLEDDKAWLWAGFINGHFTIRIAGFPVRVYRAPADGEVPERYAERCQMELMLLSSALTTPPAVGAAPEFLYRIEVVTGAFGKPVSVALVEVDALGIVTNTYVIPRSAKPFGTADVRPIRKRKPPVVPKETEVGPTKEKEVTPLTIIHKENPA